ncbi:hypothetical protein [Xanthovirga aplysinae]|uniref:hypothetical protein n=1 Tax=Xanthovirga aplysinae TaxID=2529853 RepID=UPI0012BBF020|nr:hypothetical protein [Xanthovirga aplysinae]MTI33446.1 hypothetical protein [Xanthovirga aplysinae]
MKNLSVCITILFLFLNTGAIGQNNPEELNNFSLPQLKTPFIDEGNLAPEGNLQFLFIKGNYNHSSTLQIGSQNRLVTFQHGKENHLNVSQMGKANTYEAIIEGSNVHNQVIQLGKHNQVHQFQFRNEQSSTIIQYGNQNKLTLLNTSNSASKNLRIFQKGENMKMIVLLKKL